MDEVFKIENDKTADWAIAQIRTAENERDRLIALANEQIKDLEDRIEELKTKCESDTAFLKSCLIDYFQTVTTKETKTQKTYKLLSGTLVFKKPSTKIIHNDEKLLEYLENNDGNDFIKIKKSVDWAGFKEHITISDGDIVDIELGTVIPNDICSVEDVPASFNIKYKEDK
jgi:phage host-nuclease inhibitor protein Gam